MLYRLVCNHCNNFSESASRTDHLFTKAMNEGFKIESNIEPFNKDGQSGNTIIYKYECPICKSKDVKLKIIKEEKKTTSIKYLYNKINHIDSILNMIEDFEGKYKYLEEIYNNDYVNSGKKNINIYLDKNNNIYLKVLRVVEDSWVNIYNYLDDYYYNNENIENIEVGEFDIDNVYDLFDKEYHKSLMYNFYVIKFTEIEDFNLFISKTFNNKEIFDIKNKLDKRLFKEEE